MWSVSGLRGPLAALLWPCMRALSMARILIGAHELLADEDVHFASVCLVPCVMTSPRSSSTSLSRWVQHYLG